MSHPVVNRVNLPQFVTGVVLLSGVPVIRALLPLELRVHPVTRVVIIGLALASVVLVIAARSWDASSDEAP